LLEEGNVWLEQRCCGKLAAITVFVMGLVMVASIVFVWVYCLYLLY